MITFEILTLNDLKTAAHKFVENIGENTVFAFNGKMGVGKTTFIKAICEVLGVQESVNSPTFSIVNEYEAADGKIVYHFDCYRINRIQDALNLGTEEYLYSGNLCFIEWAENIAPLLPNSYININIEETQDEKRIVSIYEEKNI